MDGEASDPCPQQLQMLFLQHAHDRTFIKPFTKRGWSYLPADDALPKFFKTANGVRVQELRVGSGPEAQKGDGVLIDYVLRRTNGYFIYGKSSCRREASGDSAQRS